MPEHITAIEVVTESTFAIKVQNGNKWYFLMQNGGLNRLRIHAGRVDSIEKAIKAVAHIREQLASQGMEVNIKVVNLATGREVK